MSTDSQEPAVNEVLFARFQRGDEDAFAEVIALYQNRLIGFLRLCCSGREAAEELAQDTFVKLYQQRDRIYSADKILPWMMITARRMAMRESEKVRRRAEFPLSDEALRTIAEAMPATQRDRTELDQTARTLALCMDSLKPLDRELIVLRYFADLKIKEIGDVLSMPIGSVGVKLRRALDRLAKQLSDRGIRQEDLL